MSTTFAEKTIAILREYCDREHGGNVRAASRALGVDPDTGLFSRWLKCFDENAKSKQFPRIDSLGPCMDKVGAKVLAPWESESDHADAPAPSQPPATCSAEVARLRAHIMELEREIGELQRRNIKAEGAVEVLRDIVENRGQDASAVPEKASPKPSSSGSRTG